LDWFIVRRTRIIHELTSWMARRNKHIEVAGKSIPVFGKNGFIIPMRR